MSGRMKRHLRLAELEALAISDRLRRAGEILAIAQPHHVQRLLGGEHRAMAGARMVRMAVGDQRFLHRPHGVDVEAADRAAQAGRCRLQDVFRAHAP